MTELAGASILVVGATGGLGREIARALHDRGAKLTLAGRNEQALLILGLGPVVTGDVTDDATLGRFVDAAVAHHGRLDGVVYAVGAVAFGPAAELDTATLDALWAVNTRAAIVLLQRATPALADASQAGGSPFFVTLSGVVAEAPTARLAAYSAVKAALHAHMAASSRELRRHGIRLLDARPGHTETDLSTHPLAGVAPAFGAGLAPAFVASRIVEAIVSDERDLPSGAFSQAG